ncbi:MAG TPA: single-stranded DNA-binding protein [Bacteroidales bacterium]|nr:single-stranded DNA-binding protein [Bacteroidales bacterium]
MNLRNRVQLIGNLGSDPKVRVFETGKKMARFSVATTDVIKKDGKFEKAVSWHNVTAWGNNAEIAEKNLVTGTEVIIEGRLISSQYNDKSGNPRRISEIIAESLMYRNIKHAISKNNSDKDQIRA